MKLPSYMKLTSVALLSSLLFSVSVSAHRLWLQPSSYTLSGKAQHITVDAAVSNDLFVPNDRAIDLRKISVVQPDGSTGTLENAAKLKGRSVFDVELAQKGTYKLLFTAQNYSAQWKENGERQRMRGSLDKLLSSELAGKKGFVLAQSVRRVESFVTLGAPSDTVFKPTGTGLELVPITHPNDIFVDEEIQFQILKNGEPASSIEGELIAGQTRYRDDENAITVKADNKGVISFKLTSAGEYWLSIEDEDGKTVVNGQEIKQSLSYVATFEASKL